MLASWVNIDIIINVILILLSCMSLPKIVHLSLVFETIILDLFAEPVNILQHQLQSTRKRILDIIGVAQTYIFFLKYIYP